MLNVKCLICVNITIKNYPWNLETRRLWEHHLTNIIQTKSNKITEKFSQGGGETIAVSFPNDVSRKI